MNNIDLKRMMNRKILLIASCLLFEFSALNVYSKDSKLSSKNIKEITGLFMENTTRASNLDSANFETSSFKKHAIVINQNNGIRRIVRSINHLCEANDKESLFRGIIAMITISYKNGSSNILWISATGIMVWNGLFYSNWEHVYSAMFIDEDISIQCDFGRDYSKRIVNRCEKRMLENMN